MKKKLIYLGLAAALTAGAVTVQPVAADPWVCTTTCENPSCCTTCCSDGRRVICTSNPCHIDN